MKLLSFSAREKIGEEIFASREDAIANVKETIQFTQSFVSSLTKFTVKGMDDFESGDSDMVTVYYDKNKPDKYIRFMLIFEE